MTITKEQVAMRKRWVKALRSGKYQQTRGQLRDDKGFCCLGVACDLYDKNGWHWGNFMGHSHLLPFEIGEHYGLTSDVELSLARMNDGGSGWSRRKHDFSTIADAIELITLADIDDARAQGAL